MPPPVKKSRSKTSPKSVRARAREQEAIDLRRRGKTYAEIAAELGCSKGTAHVSVMRALAETAELTKGKADELRELEAERLDALLDGIWDEATDGNARAVDTAIRIIERRSRLYGLDAPLRQEISGPDGAPIAVDDARSILASKLEAMAGEYAPTSSQPDPDEPAE